MAATGAGLSQLQEMEVETRIALAAAKAMARRMLGDEKGAREYEVYRCLNLANS